jgi:hypothetical protein
MPSRRRRRIENVTIGGPSVLPLQASTRRRLIVGPLQRGRNVVPSIPETLTNPEETPQPPEEDIHNSESEQYLSSTPTCNTLNDLDSMIRRKNHNIFRSYQSCLIQIPQRMMGSFSLYILHDFDIVKNDIRVKPLQYAVVAINNVTFQDGNTVYASCNLCDTKTDLVYHMKSDWSNAVRPAYEKSDLFPCKHAYAAVSTLVQQFCWELTVTSDQYPRKVAEILSTILEEAQETIHPGTWMPMIQNHTTKFGNLQVYITELYVIIATCWRKPALGKPYLHCFKCPRSRKCVHVRLIPLLDQLHDEMAIEDTLEENEDDNVDLSAYEKQRNRFFSSLRYPHAPNLDPSLAHVLSIRQQLGGLGWLDKQYPGRVITPEVEKCCGQACISSVGKRSSKVESAFFSPSIFLSGVTINTNQCQVCQITYNYDGRKDGVINWSNSKLLCIELILELLQLKVHGGTATQTYWKTKVEIQRMVYPVIDPTADNLRQMWLNMGGKLTQCMSHYISLVDLPQRAFQCCEIPKVVCVDGIVLSTKQQCIVDQKLTEPYRNSQALRNRFNSRADRNVLNLSKDDSDILKSFIREGVSVIDMSTFVGNHPGPISKMIKETACLTDNVYTSPALLIDFYHCLYKEISPASSMLPAGLWSLVEETVRQKTFTKQLAKATATFAPVFGEFVIYALSVAHIDHLCGVCVEVAAFILQRAKNCFKPTNRYEENIRVWKTRKI